MSTAGAIAIDINEVFEPEQVAEFLKLSPSEQMDVMQECVEYEFARYFAEEAAKPKQEHSGQLLLF
jgi:hypothetical protein